MHYERKLVFRAAAQLLCLLAFWAPALGFAQAGHSPLQQDTVSPSAESPIQNTQGLSAPPFVVSGAPRGQEQFWFVAFMTTIGGLAGAIVAVSALRVHISRQQRKLVQTEQRLDFILDSIDAYVYIKNKDFQYVYANRKMCEELRMSAEELIGKYDWEIYHNPQTQADIHHNDERVLRYGERVTAEEVLRGPHGNVLRTMFTIKTPLQDPVTKEALLCGVSTDITSLKAVQSENHKLSFYDPLTDLPNRRMLRQKLDFLLSMAQTVRPPYALFVLDLDKFQHINDARGHSVGDMLLLRVASRLRLLSNEKTMVARLGGDEFGVLYALEKLAPGSLAEQAAQLGEQIRRQLEQPYRIANYTYVTSASVGWTLLGDQQQSADDALREADTALSHAKHEGRNQVWAYNDSMQQALEEKLSLKHDLLNAIQKSQLSLDVQSQFDADGRIAGAETLLRWQHPERGDISPSVFIPIAEDTDLISPLGDWLLLNTCQLLNSTRQYDFPISINISPAQFSHAGFVGRAQQILRNHTDQAHRLIMEVTEGTLMDDVTTAIQLMADLVELGIRFSIDDFGTGYSNLSAIKRLPLYELKLDRSLIEDIPHNANACAIAQAVMAMARQLQLQVVAEGVETQLQQDFFAHHRQALLQGFFLARPMPMADWLASLPEPA